MKGQAGFMAMRWQGGIKILQIVPIVSGHQPFYRSTAHHFCMTTQVRASHILVKTEDEANRIIKRLGDGEEFQKTARRFSSCPSGKNGGDLGWFGKGQMVPEFEQAAFAADTGKVIGPVKSQFGYHVIKVTGKK